MQQSARDRKRHHELAGLFETRVGRLGRPVAFLAQAVFDGKAGVLQQIEIDGPFGADRHEIVRVAIG